MRATLSGTDRSDFRRRRSAASVTGVPAGVCRGHVQCRIPVEETEGNQRETRVLDRHDRPVLGPGDMRDPEGVPDDHVLVDERAILTDEAWKAVATRMLVRVIARGPPLCRMKPRHPEVVRSESS